MKRKAAVEAGLTAANSGRGGCRNESGNIHYFIIYFFLKKIKVFDQQSMVPPRVPIRQ